MFRSGLVLWVTGLFFSIAAGYTNFRGAERRRWIPIQSCKTSSHYECSRAYDGIIQPTNGWSHKPSERPPQWVEFTLRETSKVNRVAMKTIWANNRLRLKTFKIELFIKGKWIAPKSPRLEHNPIEFKNGEITVNKRKDEVDVAFDDEEQVAKVRITNINGWDRQVVLNEVFIQHVPDMKGCRTVGGQQRNRECIFPFVNSWTKAVHYACTSEFGLPPWCATRVTNSKVLAEGQFMGYCNSSCEVEPDSTCYAEWSTNEHEIFGGNKNRERRSCLFPFFYNGKWHTECASHVSANKPLQICPTKMNDDGTIADIGYCGPECPGAIDASQCVTATNFEEAKGNRCSFPYYHHKKYFTKCEDNPYRGKHICATSVSIKDFQPDKGQWGYCSSKAEPCNKDECITVGGSHIGQTCKFPFRNKWTRELHWGCTTASLEQGSGSKVTYASALWCATDTTADDEMVSGKWGFCSKNCKAEQGTNCYVDDGKWMADMKKCIFPFVFNGVAYKQCAFVKGYLKCPVKVDSHGIAKESDMKPCGPSNTCFNKTTINGNAITVGYKDIGSYTNDGTKDLAVDFSFETGVEDSSENNWNVEASVSAGFERLGAEWEASVTAGGGQSWASASSQHQAHSLSYKVPAQTRVVLSQMVLSSGVFESRTFKLILKEYKLGTKSTTSSTGSEEPIIRELRAQDVADMVTSRILN